MAERPGKTLSFYLSPTAQGYLAWAVKWLKTSQSGAMEEALHRFVEQHMLHGAVYTTWNKVAQALRHVPGGWDGFEEQEQDIEVFLSALESPITGDPIPGWLEVQVKTPHGGFDTCYFDAQGRATHIRDWVPPELHKIAPNREGIAVPVEVLGYIPPE